MTVKIDLRTGINMLQIALWSEYRSVNLDSKQRRHVNCKRCKAHWIDDLLSKPERHESWCPLSWIPKFNDK